MTTQTYRVTWPDGSSTLDLSETETVDAYAMERWGRDSAAEVLKECGTTIEAYVAEAPAETKVEAEPELPLEPAVAEPVSESAVATDTSPHN